MSYRTLKRVLGESSLERKCRLAFGIVLLVLIGGSFYLYGTLTEGKFYTQTQQQNRLTGEVLTKTLLIKAHWKATQTEKVSRDLIEYIYEDVRRGEMAGYKMEFHRPEDARNEFGEVVNQLSRGANDVLRQVPGTREYQYLAAVRAKESCLLCHRFEAIAKPHAEKAGELMAVANVRFPDQSNDFNRAVFISFAIMTVSLAMLLAYFIVRYVIVKPLKHLKEVSDAISRGNLTLRSEIHTGDEFEELSHAFNRMLRSLVEMQQQLRLVNADLDAKVDQLAQANMALFEMNRLKSDFLATVSHELRTPLNSILGFGELLEANDQMAEKQHRWIRNIQHSGKMLLALINDILDLAKIESGKMELHLADVSIHDVVEGVVTMVRPLAEKKNIDLHHAVDAALPLLHQDAHKIKQILDNLLSNAVKFTPEGGRVNVQAERSDEQLILSVSDTGVGISEADQTLIFEKFRQGSAARSGDDWAAREVSGTGLGLSIVKELCRLLEGEVSVQSELGKGSTFTVQLPLHLQEKPSLDMPLSLSGVDLAKTRKSEERLLSLAARQAG